MLNERTKLVELTRTTEAGVLVRAVKARGGRGAVKAARDYSDLLAYCTKRTVSFSHDVKCNPNGGSSSIMHREEPPDTHM